MLLPVVDIFHNCISTIYEQKIDDMIINFTSFFFFHKIICKTKQHSSLNMIVTEKLMVYTQRSINPTIPGSPNTISTLTTAKIVAENKTFSNPN